MSEESATNNPEIEQAQPEVTSNNEEQEPHSPKASEGDAVETRKESNSNEGDKDGEQELGEVSSPQPTEKSENKEEETETKSEDIEEKDKSDNLKPNEKDEMDTLAHDIFGSSDEGEIDFKADATNEKDTFDVSDEENLEREAKEHLKKLAKKKEKKKKRKSREEGEESPRKKRSRKSKEEGDEEEERGSDSGEEESTSSTGRKKKEKSEIDQMFENMKAGRSRRRKKEEGTDLEMLTVIDDMKAKMDIAANLDRKANEEKQPALHKVKILEEVTTMLEKKHLQDIFLQTDILSSIRKWLEPLPDGSLVNMKIRENLLRILLLFPYLDVDTLSQSGVGKVVMFLYRSPQENAANKKMAKQLIERWSRPIFGISARYKDLESEEQTKKKEHRRESLSKSVDIEAELDKGRSGSGTLDKQAPKYHARIPEQIAFDFKVRPKSQVSIEDIKKKPKRQIEKSLMKKGAGSNVRAKNARSLRISIEGRNLPS